MVRCVGNGGSGFAIICDAGRITIGSGGDLLYAQNEKVGKFGKAFWTRGIAPWYIKLREIHLFPVH